MFVNQPLYGKAYPAEKNVKEEKVTLWMKIKVVPPFFMLIQLVSAGRSERSFQENNLS